MALVVNTLAAGLLVSTPASTPSRLGYRASVSMGLHDLKAKTMAGDELEMRSLAGKQVVALNVASK